MRAKVVFQDGFPFMLLSQESIDDLNEKLSVVGRSSVNCDHFRPNVLVSNSVPYDEVSTLGHCRLFSQVA